MRIAILFMNILYMSGNAIAMDRGDSPSQAPIDRFADSSNAKVIIANPFKRSYQGTIFSFVTSLNKHSEKKEMDNIRKYFKPDIPNIAFLESEHGKKFLEETKDEEK